MATLAKAMLLSRCVNNVKKLFTNLSLSQNVTAMHIPASIRSMQDFKCTLFHTTSKFNDLMEFFDDKKNWKEDKVQVGRSWKTDELRLKSNEELHKLWFILLKERNMLLTMEEAYKQQWKYFPNPERIDKVEDSMSNLESVVRERNKAYYMLETGTTGERPAELKFNQIGLRVLHRHVQYAVPKYMNKLWKEKYKFGYNGYAVRKFLRLYKEKIWNEKRKLQNRQNSKVASLMRLFPNLDLEAVKENYPLADIEKLKLSRKAEGHYVRK